MSQTDNTVTVLGKVVRGPFASFVNGDPSKVRAVYQIEIDSRKKDKGQTFKPWIRTLGNQAQRDIDNIKTGDVVTVHGRISTRFEVKKRFFKPSEENPDVLEEIIINEHDEDELDSLENETETIFIHNDRRLVTEIQGQDVRYMGMYLRGLKEEDIKRILGDRKVVNGIIEERIKEEEKN